MSSAHYLPSRLQAFLPSLAASSQSSKFEFPFRDFTFRPSSATIHGGLLCPLLTSRHSSHCFSAIVAVQASDETSPGIAHSPLRLCLPHIRLCFPCKYRTLKIFAFSSSLAASYAISVSSSQRFACGFLQIPPHDGHPCRPANSSPCRVCRRLSLLNECALPGAQKRRGDF